MEFNMSNTSSFDNSRILCFRNNMVDFITATPTVAKEIGKNNHTTETTADARIPTCPDILPKFPARIWLRIPSSKLYGEQEFPIFSKNNNFMARCGDWCKINFAVSVTQWSSTR